MVPFYLASPFWIVRLAVNWLDMELGQLFLEIISYELLAVVKVHFSRNPPFLQSMVECIDSFFCSLVQIRLGFDPIP